MKWWEVAILAVGGLWFAGRLRKQYAALANSQPQVYALGTTTSTTPTALPNLKGAPLNSPDMQPTLPEMGNTGITTGIVAGNAEAAPPAPNATQMRVAPFVPRFTAPHTYFRSPNPPGSGSERYGPSLPLVQDYPDFVPANPACCSTAGSTKGVV
jgi:hypothetical protein